MVNIKWLVHRVTKRWIEVCFQPWYSPWWLTGLKTSTNWFQLQSWSSLCKVGCYLSVIGTIRNEQCAVLIYLSPSGEETANRTLVLSGVTVDYNSSEQYDIVFFWCHCGLRQLRTIYRTLFLFGVTVDCNSSEQYDVVFVWCHCGLRQLRTVWRCFCLVSLWTATAQNNMTLFLSESLWTGTAQNNVYDIGFVWCHCGLQQLRTIWPWCCLVSLRIAAAQNNMTLVLSGVTEDCSSSEQYDIVFVWCHWGLQQLRTIWHCFCLVSLFTTTAQNNMTLLLSGVTVHYNSSEQYLTLSLGDSASGASLVKTISLDG